MSDKIGQLVRGAAIARHIFYQAKRDGTKDGDLAARLGVPVDELRDVRRRVLPPRPKRTEQ